MFKFNSLGSGMIEYNDFLEVYGKHFSTKKNEEREIREAFRVFDRTEEGLLDVNELKTIVTTKGEILSDSEAKALIKEAEVDSQGKIDYEGECIVTHTHVVKRNKSTTTT